MRQVDFQVFGWECFFYRVGARVPGESIYRVERREEGDHVGETRFLLDFVADDCRNAQQLEDMAYINVCNLRDLDSVSADTAIGSSDEVGRQDQQQNRRARQVEYTAKSREKSKKLRRPEARDVANAYLSAVEDPKFIEHVGDEKAQSIIAYIRSKVIHDLTVSGFDFEQVKDKVNGIVANRLTP
ncbi:hypothetical protein [Rhizobium sp. GR12]|uniref:hypothetical protein n=1 Tax=Rhizobium sp. GR12 TaxID=3053925 RepID=UPI002FBEA41C